MVQHLASPSPLGTDTFYYDHVHNLRYNFRALTVVLGILVVCIFGAVGGAEYDIGTMVFLAGLVAWFGGLGELGLRRFKANRPMLIIGPDGVSFPVSKINAIDWDDVQRVRIVTSGARGIAVTGIRFHFRPGRLRRRQFGALGIDRWEIITSVGSVLGEPGRVQGGLESLIESIERFHPVDRR